MARRPLEALFFDIDDTLYSTTAFTTRARRNAVGAMCRSGLRMDPEKVGAILNSVIHELSSNSDQHYDVLLARLGPEAYAPYNAAVIVATGVAAYHDTKMQELELFKDAEEVFRWFTREKLRLGIISAGRAIKQAEKLVRLGIVKYLDPAAVFITDQLGMAKDDQTLYAHVCRSLSLTPGGCMMVGDHPYFDVDSPHDAGWITVHSKRPGGKHLDHPSRHEPDYVIRSFFGLRDIIERDFDICPFENANRPG